MFENLLMMDELFEIFSCFLDFSWNRLLVAADTLVFKKLTVVLCFLRL